MFTVEEKNVLTNVEQEMRNAKSINTINKVYRQSRNWARYHCYFANACSPERCTELNKQFKVIKNDAIESLRG